MLKELTRLHNRQFLRICRDVRTLTVPHAQLGLLLFDLLPCESGARGSQSTVSTGSKDLQLLTGRGSYSVSCCILCSYWQTREGCGSWSYCTPLYSEVCYLHVAWKSRNQFHAVSQLMQLPVGKRIRRPVTCGLAGES